MQIYSRRFMQVGVLIFVTIALALSAQAATANASLNGSYSFQGTSKYHIYYWSATITCPGGQTATAGGSIMIDELYTGLITFDGKGHFKGAYLTWGIFDQAKSNATVIPSCTGISFNGYAVFDAATTTSFGGTYKINIHRNAGGRGVCPLSRRTACPRPPI